MAVRRHRRTMRRLFPVDLVALSVLTAALWSVWPTPVERATPHRSLPPTPVAAFVKADLVTVARARFAGPTLQDRGRPPGAATMPSWDDAPRGEDPPPPALTEPVPELAPVRIPPIGPYLGEAEKDDSSLPFAPWALEIPETLEAAGVRIDEDSLRRAVGPLRGCGDGYADVTVGTDGLPEQVLVSPSLPGGRADVYRALSRTRAPAGGARVEGRVRWFWNHVAADEAAPAGDEPNVP